MLRLLLAVLIFAAAPAFAGIADTPLPALPGGGTTLHLYSVPGVMSTTGLATMFACTSTDTAPIQVGVETFSAVGNVASDAVGTSLIVGPGATVIFGTNAAVGISVDSILGSAGSKGSARILATSKKLVCTAYVVDAGNAPPTTSWQLTIIAKTKQKAAN